MTSKQIRICPIKKTICAVLVAGNFLIRSCELDTKCEYLAHENPKPPYAYEHPRDPFTVVLSGATSPSYISPDFREIGIDPDKSGNKLYSLTVSFSSSSASSGSEE